MRMRGMPSVCITAQRVCGARGANLRLCRMFFVTLAKKLRQLSTISMARRVLGRGSWRCWICRKVTRFALRFEWRSDFHAAAKPPMIATDGRYRFSKLPFFAAQLRCSASPRRTPLLSCCQASLPPRSPQRQSFCLTPIWQASDSVCRPRNHQKAA